MNEITSKTIVRGSRCIYFTPRTYQQDYLEIKPDVGCFSSVGKIGGSQLLSLEQDCLYKGTVMHELLHSVGLWHEQSRTDRDDYVTVNYDNILADPVVNRSVNFLKYSVDYIDDLGLPYDYESIMHYGFAFFAKDPYSPTLSPKYPYAYIGQRKYISPIDVKKVQLLYGCGGHTRWDCNFEQQNTCSWTQNTDDDFDWKLFKGSTPTAFTGPSGDNTNGLGYYIFAEANDHKKQVTRLTSQRIPTNLYCITLTYHMAGYTVGSLTLLARSLGGRRRKVLFSRNGVQGEEWHDSSIEYQAREPFQLVLEAVMGQGKEGDIAVDDISIEPGFCNYKRNFRGIDLI
ncbi:zinc metalloproteinase nas-6-like [Argonauta hians]